MKAKICLIIAFCTFHLGFSQATIEWGENFDFSPETELDPQFVLADNYNTFLLTVVNSDGMMAKRQMIVRKFDQTNKLVGTFPYDFPKFDIATLYNYLGFTEGNGKVAVYTQTYSGKAKKSVIYKHEFDKATAQFTSTELATVPILSAMKSGTVSFKKSENGFYAAINYKQHRPKEEAEKNLVLVIDVKTGSVNWQKEFSFADDHTTKTFALTNSGKVVYLRTKGKHNVLVLASAEGQENKGIEGEITLQEPKAISIGSQDYILAFNAPSKGLRRGDFSNLLLYDLTSGKAIQNAEVAEINSIKDVYDVQITNVTLQNSEIRFFAEAKVEMEMAKTQTVGSFNSSFAAKTYKFGPAFVYTLGLDGTIKNATKLLVEPNAPADLYHSFGLVNIKGNYYMNTGRASGFFPVETHGTIPSLNLHVYPREPHRDNNVKYINQLVHYFPDSNRVLLARVVDGKSLSLVNINGVQ